MIRVKTLFVYVMATLKVEIILEMFGKDTKKYYTVSRTYNEPYRK